MKKEQKKIFGYYLMLDIYDCDPGTMEDIRGCYKYLDGLADILGLERLSPPFVVCTDSKKYPDKAGLSGWIPFWNKKDNTFAGSSVHTLTPANFISLDIFSCKKFDKEVIIDFVKKTFKPRKIEEQYLSRGMVRHIDIVNC